MIEHKDHFHGSDLEKIEAVYGIRKDEIVSFSANVNPLGISKKLRSELSEHIDVITTYPDREYTALRHAIATYCGTKEDHIIVGNGSKKAKAAGATGANAAYRTTDFELVNE